MPLRILDLSLILTNSSSFFIIKTSPQRRNNAVGVCWHRELQWRQNGL
jgi:hypothetical protein